MDKSDDVLYLKPIRVTELPLVRNGKFTSEGIAYLTRRAREREEFLEYFAKTGKFKE